MNTSSVSSVRPNRHHGPSLLLVAIIYIALVIAGLVAGAVLAPRGSSFPFPFQPVEKAVAYVAQSGVAIRWGSFFEFASAIPLGIFTATVVSRLRFLGVRAAGELIALYGGIAASVVLMVSGLCGWALATPNMAQDAGAVRVLQLLSYAAGGPGFVVPYGLLLAGVSITSKFYRLLPGWLVWLGIGVAVAAELASISLLTWSVSMLIPVGRFVSFIWLIGVALRLPVTATVKSE